MKKFLIGFTTFVAGLALSVTPVFAKSGDACTYIQDGVLKYAAGHYLKNQPLTTGYDIFGYNYQAHIFNGSYANAYLGRPGSGLPPYDGNDAEYTAHNPTYIADPFGVWPFRNVQLQMKWNDAWLANKDCNGDGFLDRPDPVLGSGAWLTNHATGTYISSAHPWTVNTAPNKLDIPWAGTTYSYDVTLAQSGSDLTGTLTDPYVYPSGRTAPISNGVISGSHVTFNWDYGAGSYQGVRTYVGDIDTNGKVSGTWSETGGVGASHSGTWSITGFASTNVCTVSDFVKIVAPPADAQLVDGKWYTADMAEIGPSIWGPFAIVQEIASDPCGEYGVINYMSPLRKGLGNW